MLKKCFLQLGLTILLNFTNSIPLSTVPLNSTTLNAIPLRCISMSNQECKARLEIVIVNSNNPIFYPFSVKTTKCSGNCNNINDSYTRICVPGVVKNLNVKAFNLMSRTNETRHT